MRTSTQMELVQFASSVLELVSAGRFEVLDGMMASFNPHENSPEMCLGLLRYTFPVRSVLHEWGPLVGRVADELERRDLDVKGLMKGLL